MIAGGVKHVPDPERVGGLAWTRRTNGQLTGAERRRLIAAIVAGQWDYVLGRAKLVLGRVPQRAAAIDVAAISPPDTALAREAEAVCEEQPASIVGHSYRTWLFGNALAALDRVELDAEQFYCASLLHDYGIAEVVSGQDFTVRSADSALGCVGRAGAKASIGEAIADAICVHPTPGITVERDGAVGCYVQAGAMVDAGLRLGDIAPRNREAVLARYPRGAGFRGDFAAMIRNEAHAVPGGRFALLTRMGFPILVRVAPLRD
jgi:hypothetical protein